MPWRIVGALPQVYSSCPAGLPANCASVSPARLYGAGQTAGFFSWFSALTRNWLAVAEEASMLMRTFRPLSLVGSTKSTKVPLPDLDQSLGTFSAMPWSLYCCTGISGAWLADGTTELADGGGGLEVPPENHHAPTAPNSTTVARPARTITRPRVLGLLASRPRAPTPSAICSALTALLERPRRR